MKSAVRTRIAMSTALAGGVIAALTIGLFATGSSNFANSAFTNCGYGFTGYGYDYGYGDCPFQSPTPTPTITVSSSPTDNPLPSSSPTDVPSSSPTNNPLPSTSPSDTSTPLPCVRTGHLQVLSNTHTTGKNGKVELQITINHPVPDSDDVTFYRRSGLTGQVVPAGSTTTNPDGIGFRTINGKTGAIQRIYAVVRQHGCYPQAYSNDVAYKIS